MGPSFSVQPSARSSDQGLALLVEHLTARLQAGEAVDLAACVQEHPQYARELEQLLPALQALARLGQSMPAPAPEAPAEGLAELGDFRVVREVGRGGMGVVYEAEQKSL